MSTPDTGPGRWGQHCSGVASGCPLRCTCRCTASCLRGWTRQHVRPGICPRSEEHTSELQSQSNLVCRLLLEKKKSLMLGSVLEQTFPLLVWLTPDFRIKPSLLTCHSTIRKRLPGFPLTTKKSLLACHTRLDS